MTTTAQAKTDVAYDDKVTDEGHFALTVKTLAYLDTFAGLIPCVVTQVRGRGELTVRVTAGRLGYAARETVEVSNNDRIPRAIPRTMVYVRRGQYRIAGHPVIAYPPR